MVWKLVEDRDGGQSTSGRIHGRVASGRILQFGESIARKIPRQEFGHIVWCFSARVGTRFKVPVQPEATACECRSTHKKLLLA